jgi:hypothetical protein
MLKEALLKYGDIEKIEIIKKKRIGKRKGFFLNK